MADASTAKRMFDARQDLEKETGKRISLEEIGRRVAKLDGKTGDPYDASVVRRWLKGLSEPDTMKTWRALSAVLNVRLGWLANGELPVRDKKHPTASDVLNHFPNVVPGATESSDAFFARKAREEADDEANRQKPGGRRGKGA